MKWQKREGFTLLEVMIVVLLIGLLSAVPSLIGATDEAKEARIRSDLGTIGMAVELYHVKHGAYPTSINQLVMTKDGQEGHLKALPDMPDKSITYSLNSSTGEVTCTFKEKTYSSFGMKKAKGAI